MGKITHNLNDCFHPLVNMKIYDEVSQLAGLASVKNRKKKKIYDEEDNAPDLLHEYAI